MSSRPASVRKTVMTFGVALIVSVAVAAASSAGGGGRSFDRCGLQENTIVGEYKLSKLDRMFGETLTTESNGKIYVVSICRPVPKMFYDPRKLSGAIKLTPGGNTVDLGHIDQSNVIVNENSIVLTYVGGDRDRNVEDTCKGLRWTTYLTFLCDPTATHDILTLIDEDPDQPEICQVWFEITTSKTCNRQPHLPLVILEKDFSTLKNQIDHKKYNVRQPINSNEIPSIKNAFDYETRNVNKNNEFLEIENKEKPIINDLYNKYEKSFNNEHLSTSKENKTTNAEIKNGNTTQIISKDEKKQSDNENKDNYLNTYKKSIYEKSKKEEGKEDNLKTNIPEDKMSADHENNKLWVKKNMSHYVIKEHYPSNEFENKFIYFKNNNTVPDISSNKEYSYPGKNETISHYNYLKNYLNQNKNSEGKYENSDISESTKYDENKDVKLNKYVPKDDSDNNMEYKKFMDNENMEKTSRHNTFENKTSYMEMNDSGNNKKTSDNENKNNYLNTYKESIYEKNEKEKAKEGNLKTNIPENKMSADHENNKLWVKKNMSLYEIKEHYPSNEFENKFIYFKNNNTVPDISSKKEYNYPGYKKPSNDEKNINQENAKKLNLNKDTLTYNRTLNSDSRIKYNTTDEGKIVDTSNQSKLIYNNSIIYDNEVPGGVTKENEANQTHSQNNNPESKSFQKENQKNEIVNNPENVNDSVTGSTPRADSTTENKPTDSGEKGVDVNQTIDVYEKITMKNNYNSTGGSDNNTIAVTIKPTKTSSSNTIVNDNTNESGEVNGLSTESPVNGSLNNIKTNSKSEQNGTNINEIDKVNKNLQPDEPLPEPSAYRSDNGDNDNSKTTIDTNQSGDGFSFGKLFSNIFPNGIHVSAATIIGALASLTVVTGVVGTAINRYYYKLSGTDQIPFKGTFQSISNSIKGILISFCCCCRRGGYDDIEAPDLTNEKTPLLQPKFNIPTPLVVDETSQKSSDSGENDDSSKQNSNNEYGSMSNEKKSSTSEKKYRKLTKTKRKSKVSDTNLSGSTPENESIVKNINEKLVDIENSLQGKSIKEVISGKINTIFTEKLKPTINSIVEKVGKKVESTDEIKKNLDIISKDAALISKFVENEKSTKNIDDVQVDVGVKTENNLEKAHSNEIETHNAVAQEEIKSITLDESQQSPIIKPVNEVIVSQVSVPNLNQVKSSEQAIDSVATNELKKLQDTVVTSPSGIKAKTNESKLKFLGLEKEDKNVQKVATDESIASDKKIENEEDDVEVIEEIIYIDGADGDENEEIIEEIIETTTIEDSPDTLDESLPAGSGHTKVTVKTTRKISSSSAPGEVRTIEETVVTDRDGTPDSEKKLSGFQFGVGKSGISMSVGDKKMEIGKSGLKLNRSKSKSPKNVEGDEPDKRDTKSPEKSKKSMSLPKLFKRSISQPTDDDIQEAEDESASTKKLSRTGSGLLKLGKSRSKSTVVLKTGDVTIDTDAMLNFMDNERNASRISNAGPGEFDLTVGDEGVAGSVVVRKTSTTTSEGKGTPVSVETVEISPVNLGFGSDRDRQPTKSAEAKSNAKAKREKKDKTKLTTLTRPF